MSDESAPLKDGETYVYAAKDSAGVLEGSASVTITLVEVPYTLLLKDTSSLSANSTVRDLFACGAQNQIDPNVSDVITLQVSIFTTAVLSEEDFYSMPS